MSTIPTYGQFSPDQYLGYNDISLASEVSPFLDPSLKRHRKAPTKLFKESTLYSPIVSVRSSQPSQDGTSYSRFQSAFDHAISDNDEESPVLKRKKSQVAYAESDDFLDLSLRETSESERDSEQDEDKTSFVGPRRPPKSKNLKRVDDSLSDNSTKLSHESIAKFIAHECDCGRDCSSLLTRKQVLDLREGYSSQCANGMSTGNAALAVINSIVRKHPITGVKNYNYSVHGVDMCQEMFRCANGICKNAWSRAKAACRQNQTEVPRASRSTASIFGHVPREQFEGRSERANQTSTWIQEYIQLHGCQMPDSRLVYIDDISVPDLAHECAKEVGQFCLPLAPRQFRRVWTKNFATWCKKRARKPFGTCIDCAGYKARLSASARDRDMIARIKAEYLAHLDVQKVERKLYYMHRKKGMESDAISVIIDGMDQSKLTLPHFKLTPKDVSNFLETKITGVLVHGKRFDCYISEPQVKHDTNLNLTCLHNTLMAVAKEGPLPPTLYLQVDGGPDNKNKWTVSYLSLLVEMRVFDKIKMSYLPVGHTHEDIDQAFSRIAVYLNRNDALTYSAFVEAIRRSFLKENRPPNVICLGHAFDFKAWLDDRLPDMSSWTDNLCYRFGRNPVSEAVEMHYKYYGQTPAYFGGATTTKVTSFKALRSQVTGDPTLAVTHRGLLMPFGKPDGDPNLAENHAFGVSQIVEDDDVPISRLILYFVAFCTEI